MEKHYTLLKAAELLGVTTQTLRNWDNAGKIRTIRTPGNQRRIPESEISRLLTPSENDIATTDKKPQRTADISGEAAPDLPEKTKTPDETTIELPSILESKDSYLLMCKDIAIFDITESLVLNESLLPGCILNKTMDFRQWMDTRYSRETNFSAQRLIQRAFGSSDYEHAAFATGAFSLSDCYWIKQKDDNIQFSDITPYIHKDWIAAESNGLQNEYIWGSLSNLFVSGKIDKLWIDAQTLLKVNSFKEIEPYALCNALALGNTAQAHKTEDGVVLSNFTNPDLFYESMEQSGVAGDNENPQEIMIEKYKELAVALFVIDYLVENNDRHCDDYGFLRCSNTGDYISMAPYYNFDWIWSGEVIPIPNTAWLNYKDYIRFLCKAAISFASDFEYGTIIERRATELLQI